MKIFNEDKKIVVKPLKETVFYGNLGISDNELKVKEKILEYYALEDILISIEALVDQYVPEDLAKEAGYEDAMDAYMCSESTIIELKIFKGIVDDTEAELEILLTPEEKSNILYWCFEYFSPYVEDAYFENEADEAFYDAFEDSLN